jgi:glycosyltransferase involved in cell wall biosynthesis
MYAFQPFVSLGLTVYNSGSFLQEMLNSLLSQSFQNFELIILDNASTDQTEAVCKTYASRDPRVRYYRQQEVRQDVWNRNCVLDLATGTYFKFITFAEALTPNFLEKYVELMCDRSGESTELISKKQYPYSCSEDDCEIQESEHIMWQQEPEEWLLERVNQKIDQSSRG